MPPPLSQSVCFFYIFYIFLWLWSHETGLCQWEKTLHMLRLFFLVVTGRTWLDMFDRKLILVNRYKEYHFFYIRLAIGWSIPWVRDKRCFILISVPKHRGLSLWDGIDWICLSIIIANVCLFMRPLLIIHLSPTRILWHGICDNRLTIRRYMFDSRIVTVIATDYRPTST